MRLSVRINNKIAEEIKRSGLTPSEYTRRALEAYNPHKEKIEKYQEVVAVEKCIQILMDHQDSIKSNMIQSGYEQLSDKNTENVRQSCQTNTPKVSDMSDKNKENVRQFVRQNEEEMSDKNKENVRQMEKHELYQVYKPYFKVLSKLLNLHKQIPQDTKQKITHETNTSTKKLNDFLFEFSNDIKKFDWSIASEKTYVSFEDATEK